MEMLMRCPVDNETLVMADRNGVEIDYCPKCRGNWLDRGELDKIIDRASGTAEPIARSAPREAAPVYLPEPGRAAAPPYREEPPRRRDDDDDDHHRGYKKKRRESFLGDLFDF
jgi:Zn-finger nucleic acid-binding protein